MSIPVSLEQPSPNWLQRDLGKFLTSGYGDILAGTWLGQWLIIGATALLVRSQTGRSNQYPRFARSAISRRRRTEDEVTQTGQLETLQQLIFDIQANIESEEQILLRIVKGVVEDMRYLAALVATYEEKDDSLPVRTYYVNPDVASEEQIHLWETLSSQVTGISLTLSDPKIARVEVHKNRFATNLSVRAYRSKRPVKDSELISLFRPVVPDHRPAIRCVVKGIQKGLGIKEVIAVPFFRPTAEGDTIKYEFVGNLFALTTARSFEKQEVQLLQAFGQQAAAGLKNARLYHQLEEQRLIAEERRRDAAILADMAFFASTNLHDLNGMVGLVRGIIDRLETIDAHSEEDLGNKLNSISDAVHEKLDTIANMLDRLRKPFKEDNYELTDVNQLLISAKKSTIAILSKDICIDEELAPNLPKIMLPPSKLMEVFKVLLKNASEATKGLDRDRRIWIKSENIKPTRNIRITIRDNGTGIAPENIEKLFRNGFTTKKGGYGFGLFLVKYYIEGLGGAIHVLSVPGESTAFELVIPVQPLLPIDQGA